MTILFSTTCNKSDAGCISETESIKAMLKGTLSGVTCTERLVDTKECTFEDDFMGTRPVCSDRHMIITECSGEQGFKASADDVRAEVMPPCFQPDITSKTDGTCQQPISNFFSESVSRWKKAICTFHIEAHNGDKGGTWKIACTEDPVAATKRLFSGKEADGSSQFIIEIDFAKPQKK